ncbi:MAG: hypothetical protein IJ698_00280 [Prevotella sp.]|nr:hypothetical protein [Prevotella sp.]
MTKQLKGYPLTFNIYAASEEEVAECRSAIIDFIKSHADSGRAVTGKKVTEAIKNWERNPIVRNRIINHFK